LVSVAAKRAAALIAEIAGGTVEDAPLDVVQTRFTPRTVVARIERIRKLLGVNVERDSLIAGLERLGISVERSAGAIDCVIPSWRPDLTMEDDIAEEVGRIALGYENLPETLVPVRSGAGSDSPKGIFTAFVRETLIRAGLQDCLTHSVVEPMPMNMDEAATHLSIRLPLTPQLSGLRTALLPNLLKIVATANTDGIRDAAVFEIGSVYRREENGQFREPLHVSGAITGTTTGQGWGAKPDAAPADFYYAKGIVETLLRALGVEATFAPATVPNLHTGRTAQIIVDNETLGYVGELSETAAQKNELPRRVYVFDLDGDALMARFNGTIVARAAPLSRYPSVTRDLAPVFDSSVPFARIEQVARESAGELLESFALTDVYEGENLGTNKRALTLRFTWRSPDATLTDAQITDALTRVRGALEREAGAQLRG
ncbi:MAG: hypothetical protein H7Y38_01490, partial [Armatimonadetes bacterium]|nr:hypothetical protein [Armatimonadota bacterium]